MQKAFKWVKIYILNYQGQYLDTIANIGVKLPECVSRKICVSTRYPVTIYFPTTFHSGSEGKGRDD